MCPSKTHNFRQNQNMPKHIAIIMDGNRRWAEKLKKPRRSGHQAGAGALKKIVSAAAHLGVPYFTVYGFSSENWQRPSAEIDDLMDLLRLYLARELKNLHKNNIRLRFIGILKSFDKTVVSLLRNAEEKTKLNNGLNFIIALNYGARSDIILALRKICKQVANKKITVRNIDENLFSHSLSTQKIPDSDLIIRTGGEVRLSNFLLWESAYAELFFTKKLWPDFNKNDLMQAIESFKKRDRRYGGSGDE